MNIENEIKDVISKKLEEGIIEKLIAEKLEEGIKKALDSLFGSYGDITKTIEKKVKEVMIPQLENINYSEHIIKLDEVLKEILKNTTLDNVKLLSNFKTLMMPENIPNEITVSQIFDKYCDFVAKDIDCSNLEVDEDDEPTYEYVDVSFEVIQDETSRWSSYEYANIIFECEKDEDMNFEIRISKWKDRNEDTWDIDFRPNTDIHSLRYLNDFKIYILKLIQNYTKIKIDKWSDNTEVQPEAEPEPSWS